MPNCAVATCGNYNQKTKGTSIVYHIFPKDPTVRKQWIEACKRGDKINTKYATVCSVHFTDEDYLRDLKSELLGLQPNKVLKPSAVPSLNLSGRIPTSGKAWGLLLAPKESMVETHFVKCEPSWLPDTKESCNFESNQQISTVGNLTNIKVEGQPFTDDGISKEIVKVEHEMQDVMEEAHREERDISGDPLNETWSSTSAISEITSKNKLKTEVDEINRSKNIILLNCQLKIQSLLKKCIPECGPKLQHLDTSSQNEDQCMIINGKALYPCNQCNKAFRSQKCRKQHALVHSGERPYSCDSCWRSFARRKCLRQHALVHSGERPYSCDTCRKSFTRRGHLTAHILTHSQLKPYTCPACSRGFTKTYALKRHVASHNADRPYSCSKCSRMFKFKCSLDRHLLMHTQENYSCSKCSRTFTVKCSLIRHLLIHSDLVEASNPVISPKLNNIGHTQH